MKKLLIVLAVICLSSIGCGDDGGAGSNSGGGELVTVTSGAFASTQFEASNASKTWHVTEAYAADTADMCGKFSSSCESATPAIDAGTKMLRITMFAGEEYKTGRYTIGSFDEEDTPNDELVATVDFLRFQSNSQMDRESATAGFIDIESFDAQSLSGTYELTIADQVETGSFSISHCESLQTNRDNC